MSKSVIVGFGEIGKSLYNILNRYYEISTYDIKNNSSGIIFTDGTEILHICFPFTEQFIDEVKKYQERFKPKYTVIHSTVPHGTSRKLNAIHSPCRGLHPNLESGLLTFPKFLGGENAQEVADYFRRADMKVILFDKPETTEALKLFDTEYYRHCIEFAQRVKKYCNERDLNFSEVYTIPNQTYNEGYTQLGHPEFVRPVLQPMLKEIGGHCLLPNQKLLNEI